MFDPKNPASAAEILCVNAGFWQVCAASKNRLIALRDNVPLAFLRKCQACFAEDPTKLRSELES